MNARETAVKTLIRCEQTRAYASLVLDKKLTDGGLSDVVKAFATRLVFGTLDNQIKIDHIISQFSKIKLDKMSPTVRNCIRVAVFQIFTIVAGSFLETPTVWHLAELFNGLMAIPNLITLAFLTPEVVRLTKDYKKPA